MRQSDLTLEFCKSVLKPTALLANAPKLDGELYGFLLAVLVEEGVTQDELRAAIVEVVKSSEFWPGPAKLLALVQRHREASYAARQEHAATNATLERQEYMKRLAASYEEQPEVEFAPMDGLPVPPPREPLPADVMQRRNLFGPVLLPDGRRDPRWPEVKGREPAWRRKMAYDHGLYSYRVATAPTTNDAMRAKHLPDTTEQSFAYPEHAQNPN